MKEENEQSKKMAIEREFLSAYDDYSRAIYRHIYFRVSNKELADDLTSETFLKSWNYIAEGKTIKTIKSFLYKTANNLIIDYYRQKYKESLPLDETIEISEQSESLSEKLEKKISMEAVMENLNKLPKDYIQILIYRYVDELSIPEIKELTGKSATNIYVMIHRALKEMKKRIEERE